MNEESLFVAALERPEGAEREAFLDEACGEDRDLRARLHELLAADDRRRGILDRGAEATHDPAPAMDSPLADEDLFAGRFQLRQKLGEGGMGEVWIADQIEPIRRRVALKVILPGLNSESMLVRFEQERQALARMDHPNVAKVLDAGVSSPSSLSEDGEMRGGGRPYFVMELIDGMPITQYCDQMRLSPRQRLELFIPVCHAVQHAHQKGIIHRDLKPSNVLVAHPPDSPTANGGLGGGIPKVIDFGVAKAVGPRLTEQSIITEVGALIGTLEYMSPEQAELNNLDVDTRTDVYALGAVLYELLTGSVPFPRVRERCQPLLETLQIIRHEEPTKPSTRLSSVGSLPSIAAVRQVEPNRLVALLRGDLDWIIIKCLEKDRARRYETANDLALDIQRHLADEPVAAGPPSAAYRLAKFVRKHRKLLGAAATFALLLTMAAVTSSWLAYRATVAERAIRDERDKVAAEQARAAEEAAIAKATLDFLENRIVAAAGPRGRDGGLGHDVSLRQALEAALPHVATNFRQQPLVEAHLRILLGHSFSHLGDHPKTLEQYQRAQTLYAQHRGPEHPATLTSAYDVANALLDVGRLEDALKLHEATLALRSDKLGPHHVDTLDSITGLANVYFRLGRHVEARRFYLEALSGLKATRGPRDRVTIDAMVNLANATAALGDDARALELRQESLALHRAELGDEHPNTLDAMNNLAESHFRLGQFELARRIFDEALEGQEVALGHDHPTTLNTMGNLANCLCALGRLAEAADLQERTLALKKDKTGADHLHTLNTMHNLGIVYTRLSRHEDALRLRQEALALHHKSLPPDHPSTLRAEYCVAESLSSLGRSAEALPLIDDFLQRAEHVKVHPGLLIGMIGLRLAHFARIKDPAGCRATAETWEALNRTDAESSYVACKNRAVLATVIRQADPSGNSASAAEAEEDAAMAWLTRAAAAGFKDAARLAKDQSLASLRDRNDFRLLMIELQPTGENSGCDG